MAENHFRMLPWRMRGSSSQPRGHLSRKISADRHVIAFAGSEFPTDALRAYPAAVALSPRVSVHLVTNMKRRGWEKFRGGISQRNELGSINLRLLCRQPFGQGL